MSDDDEDSDGEAPAHESNGAKLIFGYLGVTDKVMQQEEEKRARDAKLAKKK